MELLWLNWRWGVSPVCSSSHQPSFYYLMAVEESEEPLPEHFWTILIRWSPRPTPCLTDPRAGIMSSVTIWVFMGNLQEVLSAHHQWKGCCNVGYDNKCVICCDTQVSSTTVSPNDRSILGDTLLQSYFLYPSTPDGGRAFLEKAWESHLLALFPQVDLDSWISICRSSWRSWCESLIMREPLRENLLQMRWKMSK